MEIYTENLYLTKDIDMVNTNYQTPSRMHQSMAELGFRKQGRIYLNDTTDITVEFPPGPLSVGDELIKKTTFTPVSHRHIPILCVGDVVKDRLVAFIHWQDRQSLVQALAVILKHQLKPQAFREFCLREGSQAEYEMLKMFYNTATKQNVQRMDQLEALLTQMLFDKL